MNIKEYIANFTNEVQAEADALLISIEDAFLSNLGEKMKDSEVISDYNIGYFKGKGRRNRIIEINGYSYEDADGSFNIFVVDDLDHVNENLINTDIDRLIKKAEELVFYAIEEKFIVWEESSVGYEVASDILRLYNNREKTDTNFDLKRIRIFLLTNKILSNRFKNEKREPIYGVPVEYSIYDASRLYDMAKVGFEKEPVDIDFKNYGSNGVKAIKCTEKEGEFTSYLAPIPGETLSDIYLEHGTQVLEGNVRAFLSLRGKVNKGIRQTILENPEKFFVLNNGITVTCSSIKSEIINGEHLITQINNLQIVNGGQTTASLANAKLKSKADLSKIQVMMKLSVIENNELVDRLVPEISRASNSQNKVDEADFFSNHPFHVKIEDLSKKILAPSVDGNQYQTTWFYERARGQYDVELLKLTKSQESAFKLKNPKNQVLKKTDLAKYYMSYEGYPHETSKGAQRVMREFSNLIQGSNGDGGLWEENSSIINEQFFRDIVAKAILFKETEKIVSNLDWYKEIKAYRANIVAYTIAVLSNHAKKLKLSIDLKKIWNQQQLYDSLIQQIIITSREVYENLLTGENRDTLNVTEWAKRENCWKTAQKIDWTISKQFINSLSEIAKKKKNDVDESTIDSMQFVLDKPAELWLDMKEWGKKYLYLLPKDEAILDLASSIYTRQKIPTDRQFTEIVKIYNSLINKGFTEDKLA